MISRRRGSAMALKASVVVAARAMADYIPILEYVKTCDKNRMGDRAQTAIAVRHFVRAGNDLAQTELRAVHDLGAKAIGRNHPSIPRRPAKTGFLVLLCGRHGDNPAGRVHCGPYANPAR